MNDTWHAQYYLWSWHVTLAWDNANANYQYETQNNGAHVAIKVTPSNGHYFDHYDSLITGDLLYFDWGHGEGLSHAAIQVSPGTSHEDSSWVGDLSDQHVTDRYHVSWNHIEVNADWCTTTIWEVSHA